MRVAVVEGTKEFTGSRPGVGIAELDLQRCVAQWRPVRWPPKSYVLHLVMRTTSSVRRPLLELLVLLVISNGKLGKYLSS